ncbi:MAG: hypothetical protein ACR2HC_05265 [Thermoleophilaceae bacterium]
MRFGCIDIGSNTTRLLVAEIRGGELEPVEARRHFTRIGAAVGIDGQIPEQKIAEVAAIAGELAERSRALGAPDVTVVATAAVRAALNRDELTAAVAERAGVPVRVVSGGDEAELSFHGACHAVEHADGALAVIDVGGGSTEIAVGTADAGVSWSTSLAIGSGLLGRRHLTGDPPSAAQIEAAHAAAAAALGGITPPPVRAAVAVGGTATSLHRLVGPALTRAALERGLARVCERPAAQAARELGLPEERIRLLPAGIVVLCAVADLVEVPLSVAGGGLREGVLLQRAREAIA